MKGFVKELLFGKNTLASGMIAMVAVGAIALGCSCGKDLDLGNIGKNTNSTSTSTNSITNTSTSPTSDGTIPSEAVVEELVKETTAQFADAVDSEDFSNLHSSASEDFQTSYSVEEMKTAFKSYTDKKKIVVPVLRKVESTDAEFTSPPGTRTEKGLTILMAKGKFPTKPYNVRYDYEYVLRGGDWKLLKLVINIP